jgi:apurinic endonuclease APN1
MSIFEELFLWYRNQMNRPFLGAHVSAAGGLWKAIENGEKIGAECIQIFGASPRSYGAPLPSPEIVARFKEQLKKSSIKSVFQHGAYLPNLGTADAIAMKRSIGNLTAHLQIANLIGSVGVNFHVGSPNGGDRKEALERAAAAMKEVLERVKGDSYLIMENSGSVKKIGGSVEELAWLFKKIKDSRVKICIDTAHSFEAGLIESYTPKNIKNFFDRWDDAVGIKNVVDLHINDSKTAYNSQHDKHENLGHGQIGLEGFRALAQEKRLAHMSLFLEVPGFDDQGPDKQNMDILKSCFN